MKKEWSVLFAAKCDGTITPEQHAELETLLTSSAEARRKWFEFCDMETGLAGWAAARAQVERLPVPEPPPSRKSRAIFRWLAPLAAAAAIAAGVFWWPRPAVEPVASQEVAASGIALLTRAVGAEWEGSAPAAGTVLAAGNLRLRSGAVLLEFFSGARLIIEGPAEWRMDSAGAATLSAGRLMAHVPPQTRGFTVRAGGVTVIDHGADFGITLQSGAGPEVHVFTGNVEVAAATLPRLMLNRGEAARAGSGQWQPLTAVPGVFLSETELIRRDSARAGRRLTAWREAMAALSAQAAVHFAFDESDNGLRRVTNAVSGAPEISHGSIIGAEWTQGRWPGKHALHFQSEADRVRFTASSPMQAMTLLTWVRVDALPRWQNVLVSSTFETPGAFRWHLTKPGELRLEIARDLGRPHADWEAVNSSPFVTPDRLGQWLLLTTTFDGQTIRHYGNGEPIGSGASFTPPALTLASAELANWPGSTQRQFAATMDEFLLLPRVLSEEEIRALFEKGKPD